MTTFLDILEDLKNRLLENTTIFNQGYAYARLDVKRGLTLTSGNEGRYIGIADVEGDYFYIRVSSMIASSPVKAKTDCNVAISQKYSCSLVAAVGNVDAFALSDAITNELLRTKVIDVKGVWVDAIAIIEQEFKGLAKSAQDSIKSRIGDNTLVRVDFEIRRIFETHNCTYQICKPC